MMLENCVPPGKPVSHGIPLEMFDPEEGCMKADLGCRLPDDRFLLRFGVHYRALVQYADDTPESNLPLTTSYLHPDRMTSA